MPGLFLQCNIHHQKATLANNVSPRNNLNFVFTKVRNKLKQPKMNLSQPKTI